MNEINRVDGADYLAAMDFVLNGRTHSLDAETVRARVIGSPPHDIRTHWVEVDGRRWPPKQAFRVATGLTDEPFISHFALRVFQRLGFQTSPIPGAAQPARERRPSKSAPILDPRVDADMPRMDSTVAFATLDAYLSKGSLTESIATLEASLNGSGPEDVQRILRESGLDADLVDSALVVRERIGMIDTLIHAAVITQVLPLILEPGEVLTKRPSLGAGNDPDRNYDLESSHRVAEFKLSSWKGRDGMRQRGLFADVVGLSLDVTGRRRQVYVVGDLPVRFLKSSRRNATKTLSKAALKLRAPEGMEEDTTVAEFTKAANIEVIDLRVLLPRLR